MFQQQPNKTPKSNQWRLTLIVSGIGLILFSLFLTPTSSTSQSYSEFIDLVESDAYGYASQIASNRSLLAQIALNILSNQKDLPTTQSRFLLQYP